MAYEIVLNGKIGEQDLLTVLHYVLVSGPVPNWDDVGTIIRGHLITYMTPHLVTAAVYRGIYVREDVPGGVGADYDFLGGPVVGAAPDDEYFTNISLQVNKNTSNGMKPTKGRVFQGGLSASATQNNGLWQANTRAGCVDFYEAIRILNVVGGAVLNMAVKARNPTAPNTVPYNLVNSIGSTSVPRPQRRRTIGQGS